MKGNTSRVLKGDYTVSTIMRFTTCCIMGCRIGKPLGKKKLAIPVINASNVKVVRKKTSFSI